ncbi:MAG: hypothetical protein ACYS1A_11390 [Planctomycetota bacterium]
MKKRKILTNEKISWLLPVITCCAVIAVSADSALGGAYVEIKVPNGQTYSSDGNFITTAFKVCETVDANYLIMDCLDDSSNDSGSETFEVAITTDSAGTNVLTSAQLTNNFGCTPGDCDEHLYLFDFLDVTLTNGVTYYLRTKVISGAPVRFWGGVRLYYDGGYPPERRFGISLPNGTSYSNDGDFVYTAFSLSRSVKGLFVIMDCLDDSIDDAGSETFEVSILNTFLATMATARITNNFGCTPGNCDGHKYSFDFSNVTLNSSTVYFLKTKVVSGAPVRFWGDVKLYYWHNSNYLKLGSPPDIDKSAYTQANSNSCWLATAANMLATAGYGDGANLAARADDIYTECLANYGNISGFTDTALRWWLGSTNNTWPENSYDEVSVYGNKSKYPWTNVNGPKYAGDQLRRCNFVGVSISWPDNTKAGGDGGHAMTWWGDGSGGAALMSNPGTIRVADSDRDTGGDIQGYVYDSYTNPNPGDHNEGNGWYFDFSNNHPFIKHIVTLRPVTNCPTVITRGASEKVISSYKIHQSNYSDANDLHYYVGTYADIESYNTTIDWDTNNVPSIQGDTCPPWELDVDWDFSDNKIPYCTWVTIDTDFTLKNKSAIYYRDVHFTYPGGISLNVPSFGWEMSGLPLGGDPNGPDVTGGYVVGRFTVVDPDATGGPAVVGEYSFVHEYSYDQDPELHFFTLRGDPGMVESYQVENIQFGHSYGLLESDDLWVFDQWMTDFPGPYPLEPQSELNLELQWFGQLPYPQGEIYSAPTEEEPPSACIEYLPQDRNYDCYVNFKDFKILAANWLLDYDDLYEFSYEWLESSVLEEILGTSSAQCDSCPSIASQ